MDNVKKLSLKELQTVTGGKHTCSVNWGQAWSEGVNRLGTSVVTGLTGIRQH